MDNQYMDMFLDESHEHLQSLNEGLLRPLRQPPLQRILLHLRHQRVTALKAWTLNSTISTLMS